MELTDVTLLSATAPSGNFADFEPGHALFSVIARIHARAAHKTVTS